MDCLFWILAAAAQSNNSQCFCGLTLLTSCLTGNTLQSPRPALPVPYACIHTLTHGLPWLITLHHTTLDHFIFECV